MDLPQHSVTHFTGEQRIGLPERSDVRKGVVDAREIGREIVDDQRYNAMTWGYKNPEALINQIGEVFGSLAAKLLDEGKSTQEVRAVLRAEISQRFNSVATAVNLIGIAVSVFRSTRCALDVVEVRMDGSGLRINGTTDEEIASVVRMLHNDVIGRIVAHGGTLSSEDIFHSVRVVLHRQNP